MSVFINIVIYSSSTYYREFFPLLRVFPVYHFSQANVLHVHLLTRFWINVNLKVGCFSLGQMWSRYDSNVRMTNALWVFEYLISCLAANLCFSVRWLGQIRNWLWYLIGCASSLNRVLRSCLMFIKANLSDLEFGGNVTLEQCEAFIPFRHLDLLFHVGMCTRGKGEC